MTPPLSSLTFNILCHHPSLSKYVSLYTRSWVTTAHMGSDPSGAAVGYGGGSDQWSGPRDFSSSDYGPDDKATINTLKPFKVPLSLSLDIYISSIHFKQKTMSLRKLFFLYKQNIFY